MKTWILGGLLLAVYGTAGPALAALIVRWASLRAFQRGYRQATTDQAEWERANVRARLDDDDALAEANEQLVSDEYLDEWVDREFEAIRRRLRSV